MTFKATLEGDPVGEGYEAELVEHLRNLVRAYSLHVQVATFEGAEVGTVDLLALPEEVTP